jgi:rod shape determining protein RodA
VAADLFGALICVGVMTMLVFQMFQSVGMTVGIMPITGIPAPFLSYGGSSAITSFVAVGLVLNVHMRRYQVR